MKYSDNSKLSAKEFIDNNIDPLKFILPLIKIHEYTEHAHIIHRSVNRDTIFKSYDYLENQILVTAKERVDSYLCKRIASKKISLPIRKQLEIKAKNICNVGSIPSFIKDFQLLEASIDKLQPNRKTSLFDKIKSSFR